MIKNKYIYKFEPKEMMWWLKRCVPLSSSIINRELTFSIEYTRGLVVSLHRASQKTVANCKFYFLGVIRARVKRDFLTRDFFSFY